MRFLFAKSDDDVGFQRAMREQLTTKTGLAYDGGRAAALLRWMRPALSRAA